MDHNKLSLDSAISQYESHFCQGASKGMSENLQYLQPLGEKIGRKEQLCSGSELFFSLYCKVPLFTTVLKKPNEGLALSFASKIALEEQLEKYSKASTEEIAVSHALLALVHWLFPSYPKFNRNKIARVMFKHALEAMNLSKTPFSESYIIGLFITLRILPFLVKTNKTYSVEISKSRKSALSLVSNLDSESSPATKEYSSAEEMKQLSSEQKAFFIASLYDAVGFSFLKLERNEDIALNYLERSVQAFSHLERILLSQDKSEEAGKEFFRGARRSFYSALASVAWWDLGYCHEALADKIEGEEVRNLTEKAKMDYEKSYALAKQATLNYYGGLSACAIAALLEAESEYESRRKKTLAILKKAVTIGEESLTKLSLWSTYDSDLLGGSWVAACYGRLADYSSTRLKHKYIRRSLNLAKRAESLAVKGGMSNGGRGRFTAAQVGHIFYRNSIYYRQLARNAKTSLDSKRLEATRECKLIISHLKNSLEYALRSRIYYKAQQFHNYVVDSSLLAGEVCYELQSYLTSEEEKKSYVSLGKKMCLQAQVISQKNDWNQRVAESNWLRAQMLDTGS